MHAVTAPLSAPNNPPYYEFVHGETAAKKEAKDGAGVCRGDTTEQLRWWKNGQEAATVSGICNSAVQAAWQEASAAERQASEM
jgi:hypothetical protein